MVGADEHLVSRVRTALSGHVNAEEKRMFGGIKSMVGGKMCLSVGQDRIMCRVDPDLHDPCSHAKGAGPARVFALANALQRSSGCK